MSTKKTRRRFTAEFKAQVAVEALRGLETVQEIARKHQVHPVQVSQWKAELLRRLPEVFAHKPPPDEVESQKREEDLYRKIGQLNMELDWLKKKSAQLHG